MIALITEKRKINPTVLLCHISIYMDNTTVLCWGEIQEKLRENKNRGFYDLMRLLKWNGTSPLTLELM